MTSSPSFFARMPKVRWLLAALGLLLAGLVGTPLINWLTRAKPAVPERALQGKSAAFAEVAPMLMGKCGDCHSQQVQMPFYAQWPIAKQLIAHDIEEGREEFEFDRDLGWQGGAPREAMLAKLEHVLDEGDMPPFKYVAMHWEAALSKAQTAQLQRWLKAERAMHFASPNVHPSLRGEVLQPVPQPTLGDEKQQAKVALGKLLYHDTRLSGDHSMSCASCHSLNQAGVDGLRSSKGIRGQIGPINAPTVFNAALHISQFWDGRAANLQEQAKGPVGNPIEMGARWNDVVVTLQQDSSYAQAFQSVYGGPASEGRVTDAIAAFEQTLLTPDAPFDRYLQTADRRHLSAQAWQGYQLFKQQACTNCHFGAALGGRSYERLGTHADYFAARGGPRTNADYGRYNVTHDEEERYMFKTPSLRNVALTGPYFHDGSAASLADAVRTMAHVQRGHKLKQPEVDALVAFLRSLTGNHEGKPLQVAQR